eukprot:364206-Chlamydomonas_euryale.AAC.1
MDLEHRPAVVESMPIGTDCSALPAVCVLHTCCELPEAETPHLARVPRDDPGHQCMRGSLVVQPDGTIAVEVAICHTLLQVRADA